MKISKKCQYALRAIFELSARNRDIPIKAREISRSQRISTKFLEVILNELKHAGFIESRRGNEGGYLLSREPQELTVGDIIESIEGPISIKPTINNNFVGAVRFGDVAFSQLWQEATTAVSQVFSNRTFAELVEIEQRQKYQSMPSYCI